MLLDDTRGRYRFPGAGYSFSEEDEAIFCGRKEAIDYIYNSILLNQCVLLFGKSGTGKSSLLQAGVIPKILRITRNQQTATCFRIYSIRTNIWQSGDTLVQRLRNLKAYRGDAPASNEFFLPFLSKEIRSSLWYKFKSLQYNAHLNKNQDIYLLIIDQVEELFTYPVDQFTQMIRELADLRSQTLPDDARCAIESYERENSGVLSSIQNEVLYSPIPVKFIFSIRSDKLHLMGRLRKAIPSILQNTFELYPFSREQAAEAIVKPSKAEGNFVSEPFDLSDVSNYVIDFLEKLPDTELEYISADCRIGPFALQVICRHIERNIVMKSGMKKVKQELINDLSGVLLNYYTDTLNELDMDNVMKLKVQQLIEEKMIYEKDLRRIPVYSKIIINELGIDQDSLTKVINSRLIKETAAGSSWYEISHDSLLVPILKSKMIRVRVEDELRKKYDADSRNKARAKKGILTIEEDIKRNPYDYKLFKSKAEHYYLNQDFSKALDYYIKATDLIDSDQIDDDLYIGLANCYYNMEMYEPSNGELRKVIDNNPANLFALYYTGVNYHMMTNYALAIDYYQRSLELEPYHKEVNINLALVYMELEKYEPAVKQFKKVLALYPDDYSSYTFLIEALILSGEQEPIEKYVRKLMELQRDDEADIHSQIANIYVKKGNKTKAIEYLNVALRLEPKNASYHADIGTIYSELGMLSDSIRHLELACEYDKKNSFYTTWLAFTYQQIGNLKEAIKLFHKAVKYDPNYRYAQAALAASYRRIGDQKSYEKYIAIAQSLSPNDAEDEYSWASFEALCGNNETALDILDQALKLRLREPGFAERDPDFEFIRGLPRFKQIIANAKAAFPVTS